MTATYCARLVVRSCAVRCLHPKHDNERHDMRTFSQQKAGLTRAAKTKDQEKVLAEVRRTVAEWESDEWAAVHHVRRGAWPDDWSRWQRALDDVFPIFRSLRIEDL